MKNYQLSLMNRILFEDDSIAVTLTYFGVLFKEMGEEKLLGVINQYQSEDFSYSGLLTKWRESVSISFLHPFQSDLLFVLLLCKRLERLYEEHGLPNALFVETMKDISYKVKECKLVKGMVGTFVATWFSGFFELNRFTFGRLQFEMVPFGVDYHEIFTKTPSINVHIPRTETPLDPKSV